MLSVLPKIKKRKRKRLGRGPGSGKGAKSTRGTTRHQKARENIPLHFEGGQAKMVKKYPLLRGKGKNKPIQKSTVVINLSDLNILKNGDDVTVETLIKYRILKENIKGRKIKILANGKLERKLNVKLPASRKARSFIEKAGGSVII